MFITYWFIIFAAIFFPIYWCCPFPRFRKIWLLIACASFHYRFAGPAGVIPVIILGVITYIAGLSQARLLRSFAITLSVLALVFYKYTAFFVGEIFHCIVPTMADHLLATAKQTILPEAPPLAISFFVFEFVHYLMDVQRGKAPIRSVTDFIIFSIFWPSVVSGPVKRFEQFIPAIKNGCKNISLEDIQIGTIRIATGLVKKLLIADNLTTYIAFWQPHFHDLSLHTRWFIVLAISMRILMDFSGYSDMAIGFARLMGIKLPENFNWPYLATNLSQFWQRWHISLSSWIRDYIYIPLGGNQKGTARKCFNGVAAFAICGLWHGAALNFVVWGLYHGIGLMIVSSSKPLTDKFTLKNSVLMTPLFWGLTFMFTTIGWLYFFYPVREASQMLALLISK